LIRVEARVDGHLINSIMLAGDAWGAMRFRLPQSAPRFARVDFTVIAPGGSATLDTPLIHVGRARVMAAPNPTSP
jgi:hypothetical protein